LEQRKKRGEAKETYQKAREAHPDYYFALQRLFWLHVEDAQWKEAEVLLKDADAHFKPVTMLSYRFIYYRQMRHWGNARETLRKMLEQQEDEVDAFYRVQEALEKIPGGELELIRKELEAALGEGPCNANAGALYVEVCRLAGKVPTRKVMLALPQETDASVRAFKSYIHWLGDKWKETRMDVTTLCGLKERMLWRWLMKKRRDWLRRNMELYGAVTYALNVARAQA
jgi:tetratricopeptide (TPR) repeat protein